MNTTYYKNLEAIISYFEVPKACASCLGLELEHFLTFEDGSPVPYFGEHGVLEILNELKPHFEEPYYVDGNLLGMYNDEYAISLEPAAQLEISISAKTKVASIEEIYDDFQSLILPVLKKHSLSLKTLGYRPAGKAAELPLIPKKRYEFMDRYFKTSGSCGINMMRGTAATQVSIDFVNEWDFIRKYRLAYILMPAFKLICDNIPVFEDERSDSALKRTYIWRNTDPARCNPPVDLFDKGFGFASYADYLLNVPLIFVIEDGRPRYVGEKTAAHLFENRPISQEEVEHVTSMVFPDVRLKRYIEIRGADSLPIEYALGYVALIKAIFYSGGTIDDYLSKYEKIQYRDIIAAEDSLMERGIGGEIYGADADGFVSSLFEKAKSNISDGERPYIEALESFYNGRKRT